MLIRILFSSLSKLGFNLYINHMFEISIVEQQKHKKKHHQHPQAICMKQRKKIFGTFCSFQKWIRFVPRPRWLRFSYAFLLHFFFSLFMYFIFPFFSSLFLFWPLWSWSVHRRLRRHSTFCAWYFALRKCDVLDNRHFFYASLSINNRICYVDGTVPIIICRSLSRTGPHRADEWNKPATSYPNGLNSNGNNWYFIGLMQNSDAFVAS